MCCYVKWPVLSTVLDPIQPQGQPRMSTREISSPRSALKDWKTMDSESVRTRVNSSNPLWTTCHCRPGITRAPAKRSGPSQRLQRNKIISCPATFLSSACLAIMVHILLTWHPWLRKMMLTQQARMQRRWNSLSVVAFGLVEWCYSRSIWVEHNEELGVVLGVL